MASHLKIDAKPEEPITIEKNYDDKHAKRFKQIKGVPKNV
jgi:hypothetical protein